MLIFLKTEGLREVCKVLNSYFQKHTYSFTEEQSKDLPVSEQIGKTACNYTLNKLFVLDWSPLTDHASIPFGNSLFCKGVAGTEGNKLTEI